MEGLPAEVMQIECAVIRSRSPAPPERSTYGRVLVYICGGRHDAIAPAANLEALHVQIPNSQLEFFEGGRAFMLQDRTAFSRVVEFLSGE
jgi:surfactin synthase thioesterase subunit